MGRKFSFLYVDIESDVFRMFRVLIGFPLIFWWTQD